MNTCQIPTTSIRFTGAALGHFKKMLEKKAGAMGVYIGIEKGGCSGYRYVSAILETENSAYIPATSNAHFSVFVQKDAANYLNGLGIDFIEKSLGSKEIVYQNPNEQGRCGCGHSVKL